MLAASDAMASDEREIRTVHSIWIDAVNAGDLARLLTLVAEDVVFLTPGQAPFGPEGFSSNFRTAHQQMRICCTSELEEVIVVGEVAYTRSRDALSVTPRAGGKAAQFAGHRMTVYRKQRDGRWLLFRDVHTLSAVASHRAGANAECPWSLWTVLVIKRLSSLRSHLPVGVAQLWIVRCHGLDARF